jgi:uncharacterized protein (TIGR02594 family)
MIDPLPSRGALRRFALVLMLGLAVALAALAPRFAHAAGRGGAPAPSIYAPGWQAGAPAIGAAQAWGAGSRAVAEAYRWLGSANPTGTIGPWCADFVSFVFQRVGLRGLANRTAASALNYGPHVAEPRRGDLVVMATRRGAAGHVGIVDAVNADGSVTIVSGNWSRRVARSIVARAAVTAFIAVR